jgi:tRNA pseudouridine38-40 synthase
VNYKLLIQYDGTDFHGWQVQDRERTVQGELESAIGSFAEETVRVTGSGRTDAGVHAEGQVANVVLEAAYVPEKLRGAINGNLCRAIRVLNVEPAPDEFHARFSAIEKTYVYRVINAAVLSPFWRRFAHHESRSLNVELMNEAAQLFVGEHDWTAFASARSDGESRVRDVVGFKVESRWDERARADLIEFRISANGFLRYMVRSIVGTLLEVGRGEKGPESVEAAIATGDRKLAGMTAPAKGLTLYRVEYPSK